METLRSASGMEEFDQARVMHIRQWSELEYMAHGGVVVVPPCTHGTASTHAAFRVSLRPH